ncbi:unnamed protein product [Cuscuta epithymum]|uniref:Uncharacterized protein n=1 Tax=Cuscuta epithymum TaxID=186058 RepID=A0AAV0BY65_9ASTE|nr:unnamed protein product [Cuscuta epithymum]
MAAGSLVFTADETAVDEGLGYPKAYAKLCKDRSFSPYSRAPPFTFTPYALPHQEVMRLKKFDDMFPIVDPNAKPTAKVKIFVRLLWKQLNHLGNAGFDPEIFRVDPYGNVLYYHADSASPLGWSIDHWFPCSRGGLTVASNLRILQWQVCKKKKNKLEFQIPWWDLQVGLSINQFLSIFASRNSDFRHRAFSWLFSEAEDQELNATQTVDSHVFPQHFMESKKKIGLSPAAVVHINRREPYDSALKSLDFNRWPRSSTSIIASKKLKENEDPDMLSSSNPYQEIVVARNSLKQREEAVKMQAEINKLDEEVSELKQKGEEENVSIQDLELILIKKRRRAEKCRKLAEAQASHRTMLEKMIRDAMHQSVVYKQQVRLNLAASNSLMARLEAQRAICDSAEKELYLKYKQRDELEQQIRPEYEQKRKRSRMVEQNWHDDDDTPGTIVLYSPNKESKVEQTHKQLRVLLEEEQQHKTSAAAIEEEQLEPLKIVQEEDGIKKVNLEFPICHESETEEDEDIRKQRGKGNVEKWLQVLLESTNDATTASIDDHNNDKAGIVEILNCKYPHKEINISTVLESEEATAEDKKGNSADELDINISTALESEEATAKDKKGNSTDELEDDDGEKKCKNTTLLLNPPPPPCKRLQRQRKSNASANAECKEVRDSSNRKEREEGDEEDRKLSRSESARGFRRIPSSPSLILSGMKKRVDCLGKKPLVTGDDEDDGAGEEGLATRKNIIKSSFKTIVKAMKI